MSEAIGTPDKVMRKIMPKCITTVDGKRIYDVGENISGVVRVTSYGKEGEKVTLRCDGYHPLLLELRPISTLWYLGHLLLPSYKKSIEVHTPGVYRCQTRGAPVSDPIHLSVSNGECLNTGGAAHVLWQGCPSCGRGHGATRIGVGREGYIESAWHYMRDALRLA